MEKEKMSKGEWAFLIFILFFCSAPILHWWGNFMIQAFRAIWCLLHR